MRDGEPDGLKRAAASGVRYTALASVATVTTGLVNTVVLGRLLGPEAFGLFAMVMVYLGFAAMVSDIGLSEALIQRKEPTRGSLASLYWLNMAMGLLLYIASVTLAPLLALAFSAPELRQLIPVAALTIPIGAVASQFGVLATKELRFKLIATIQVARALLGLAVALVAALAFDQGVWSLVWSTLAGSLFATSIYMLYGLRSFGFPGLHFSRRDLRGYLSFGGYRFGASALNYANTHADQMLIGALFGVQALGYYRVAVNLVFQPLNRINPMITQVAFPVFSKIQDDIPRMKRGFLKVVRLLTLIDAPVFIGLALVAPVAVPLVMGEAWAPAVPLIQVLVFYGMIRALPSAAGGVIMARGRADWTLHWNLALFVLIPATIYIAAWSGSVLVVAWALVGLQALLLGFHYRFFLRSLLGGFLADYVKAVGLPVLLGFAMGACVLIARPVIPAGKPLFHLGAEVITGMVVYGLLVWIFLRRDATETLNMALGRR